MRSNSSPLIESVCIPGQKVRFALVPFVHVALSAAMVVVAMLHLYPTMIAPLNIYDEGIIVYGATRVMHGEIPYRDFWTQYSPGQLYALAGLFRLFGVQIAVERWWDVVIRALLALAAFTFVLFILASLVYLVLTLLNVQVPLGVRPGG